MYKSIIIIIVILLLSACFTKKTATTVTKPKTEVKPKVEAKPEVKNQPEVSSALTENGYTIYNQKCSTCHKAYNPGYFTENDWKIIVPEMVKKANQNELTIGPGQQELILKYLVDFAKK
jgi:cytochrome c5